MVKSLGGDDNVQKKRKGSIFCTRLDPNQVSQPDRTAWHHKNKLSRAAEMQRTQINRYCTNRIARLDLDVLARLCYVFDCEVRDLLEYMPPQQEPNEETT